MAFTPPEYNSMYADKRSLQLKIVCVLRGRNEKRGLELIPELTRAICKYEIHEFILTAEERSNVVNNVAYLCFAEVESGGIMAVGDTLFCGEKEIGKVIGFDNTHMPNHMNIVLNSTSALTGEELSLQVEQSCFLARQ